MSQEKSGRGGKGKEEWREVGGKQEGGMHQERDGGIGNERGKKKEMRGKGRGGEEGNG